jgi:hypothetical protein
MQVDGLKEFSEILAQMETKAPAIAAQALYDGAGIVADAVNKSAESIKTEPFTYKKEMRLPSPEEKEIVQKAAAGIAKFNNTGAEIDTSIGFRNAGYAELNGKTVPIPMIVNAINSGTSFMQKQPFIRKAGAESAPKAMQAIKAKIEEAFEALTKK